MPEDIRRTDRDGVVTVTFTRDQKLNAVDDGMLDVLRTAVQDLGDREDLRVLIITAEGRYFTAGVDVGRFGGARPSSGIAIRRDYRRLHLLLEEIEAVEKPVVLAAQGPCLGFGVELGVSCDFRFASPRATFGLPEIATLALVPGSGGISRLTRVVGPHWTRWLAMAGEQVDADQALAIGLVHRVVPEAELPAELQQFAARLVGRSAEALGLAKLGIDAATTADRVTSRHVDRIVNTVLLGSEEHQTAVAAFQARRQGKDAKPPGGASR
ncbi:MAG: enoyl-CoA hydratase/isomerase family protein [Acidimicrobiales bacterium]